MKLTDTLILSAAVAFFMMGLHQLFTNGFAHSYEFFMFMLAAFGWYMLRKQKKREKEAKNNPDAKRKRK